MKKTVLFVLIERYADWEAAYLASALHEMGEGAFEVKTVSVSKEPLKSIGGFTTLPDYDFEHLPKDYDAVVLIGGTSWRSEEAKLAAPLVKKCVADKKLLAAICDSIAFLGAQGVLNNVKHTCNVLPALQEFAGEAYTGVELYERNQVVRDGNVITGNFTSSLEFAREVLLALNVADAAKIEQWFGLHKLGYITFINKMKARKDD